MAESQPMSAYVAEFVGTFVLVFTIGCNVLSGQPVWGGISIACALMVMIYALASSSGANFNPAVSLALAMSRKLDYAEMRIYWVCQLAGGICGGYAYSMLFQDAFKLSPTSGHSWTEACVAEILYTFMLCFVVLNVATTKRDEGNHYYGLAIGFVIVAGAYSGGSVSMGCFNPAVAFGIELPSMVFMTNIKYAGVYTVCEMIGACLACFFFALVRPEEMDAETADMRKEDLPEVKEMSKLASEFLGTYVLVLTVGLNVLSKSTAGALSIAASLMCMIYALASVSGANFNPAVSIALMVRGALSPKDGVKYVSMQVLGGLFASLTYAAITGTTFGLKPTPWHAALMGEFVFTFVLGFVVLTVATIKNATLSDNLFGFAIGMCVTLGGNAVGKISGGSLNPAVSIAIAGSHIRDGGEFWICIPYVLVECVAGVTAAVLFKVTHPSEFLSDDLGEADKKA